MGKCFIAAATTVIMYYAITEAKLNITQIFAPLFVSPIISQVIFSRWLVVLPSSLEQCSWPFGEWLLILFSNASVLIRSWIKETAQSWTITAQTSCWNSYNHHQPRRKLQSQKLWGRSNWQNRWKEGQKIQTTGKKDVAHVADQSEVITLYEFLNLKLISIS